MLATIVDAIAVAIAAGLTHPEHIEEIGILNTGIGADRISDAVCNVLKSRFIDYTQRVAERHGIRVDAHLVKNASLSLDEGRWLTHSVLLPTNPHSGKPILLAPMKILGDLPILNSDSWIESPLNSDLRLQMNLSIGRGIKKDRCGDRSTSSSSGPGMG